MKLLRFCLVMLIVVVGLSLAGCCCPGRSTTKTVVVPTQTQPAAPATLGKELEDLDAAYKKGAITKEEYDAARKKLIEQGGQQSK